MKSYLKLSKEEKKAELETLYGMLEKEKEAKKDDTPYDTE